MLFFKNIIGRIFAVYVILLFAITAIPTYLVLRIAKLILSKTKFDNFYHTTNKVWMGIYMPLIFCPVKVIGKEKFINGKIYVVVLNHNSLMDIPVSTPGIPNPNRTLGKSDFLKMPFFGFIYKSGSVIINRKNIRSKQISYDEMLLALQSNLHMCLYPEGTRNKTSNKLLAFKDGAFKLAIESNKPLMIGIIKGTKNIIDNKKVFYAWPQKIELEFLDVVETTNENFASINLLKAKAFDVMQSAL